MYPFQQNLETVNVPLGIKHSHEPDKDVVTWANKDLPKDIISIVVFFFVVFAVPIVLTGLFRLFLFEVLAKGILRVFLEFSIQTLVLGILIFVWLGAVFLALVIFRCLFWVETVVISDRYIVVSRNGFWSPKEKRFRKEDVKLIGYGRYDPWNEGQLRISINIVYQHKLLGVLPGIQSEELATFLRKKEKYQLFLYLQTVLNKRGWPTLDGA
jgi:hypothetical protein